MQRKKSMRWFLATRLTLTCQWSGDHQQLLDSSYVNHSMSTLTACLHVYTNGNAFEGCDMDHYHPSYCLSVSEAQRQKWEKRVYGIQCPPSKDHNLSLLSSPHTQLQVLTPYFITVHWAIIQLQTRFQPTISPVNHTFGVSHTTLFI